MAQIKQITGGNPLSNFTQVAPQGGSGFLAFKQVADAVYSHYEPAMRAQASREGTAAGIAMARGGAGRRPPVNAVPGNVSANAAHAYQRFLDEGIPAHVAAGLVGNLMQESGADLNTAAIGDNGHAYGAGQWNGPRMRAYFEFADSRGAARDDLDTQIDFLLHEGRTTERSAWAAIMATGTPEEAARVASERFWRPGVPQVENRMSYASQVFGGGQAAPSPPAAVVRAESGALEPRLFPPMSGPMRQLHNAAAGVAYAAEIQNQAAIDLAELGNQFLLDPEGFSQAAESYIERIVDGAPDMFAAEIQASLNREVARRTAGIMEARQSDIRARANNSTAALAETHATQFAELLAAGDTEGADLAMDELLNVLQAREALPGASWTREQSALFIQRAIAQSETIIERNRTSQNNEFRDALNLVIEAEQAGTHAADETVLSNPAAQAAHPELFAEAQAYKALNAAMPDFMRATPAEQAAAIAQMREDGVSAEFQIDIIAAAEKAMQRNAAAWQDDPVAHAAEVFQNPPPEIVMDITNPEAMAASMRARAEYMLMLHQNGYTAEPSFLSTAEAEALSQVFSTDMEPAVRAAAAASLVSGFGGNASAVFDQLDVDHTTRMAGKLMASGRNQSLAVEAMQGQTLLAEGMVQPPTHGTRIETFSPDIATALSGVPGSLNVQSGLMQFATSIYASRARAEGVAPDSERAKEIMAESLQAALGRESHPRGDTGGVQEVNGYETLLPMGVTAEAAETAILTHLRPLVGGGSGSFVADAGIWMGRQLGMIDERNPEPAIQAWRNASSFGQVSRAGEVVGHVPLWNGAPLDSEAMQHMRLVAVGQNTYRMEIALPGNVSDVTDERGNVFIFDLNKLIAGG